MARRRYGATTIEIDVQVDEVLDQLDTADLLAELSRRDHAGEGREQLVELRHLIHCRDWAGALALVERLLSPAPAVTPPLAGQRLAL